MYHQIMPSDDSTLKPHLALHDDSPKTHSLNHSSYSSDEDFGISPRIPIKSMSNDLNRPPPPNKKQSIQRSFRLISTIGFTSLVMGTWEVFLAVNSLSLRNGGIPGLF